NRGHKDFQSFALPTELWHLADLRVQKYEKLSFAPSKSPFISNKNVKRNNICAKIRYYEQQSIYLQAQPLSIHA
uniref:hypothetical protein n=1 Tax=Prevotellamassilia timonensis TaxID=1852370 RepID=UPI004038EBA3